MDALMSVPAIADSRHADTNLAPAWLIGPLFRTTVIAFAVFLFLAAAVLWSRRAVGAITTPLPPSALLAVGLVVVSTALAARYTWRLTCPPRTATLTVFPLLTVSVLAFAAATSLPGSAPIALVGLWFLIVGEELWTWWPRRPHDPPPVPDASPRPARRALTFDSRQRFEQAVADSSLGVELAQEHVTQQVTRVVEPDGTERVVGWMRVTFQPDQRLASVHLAFCPPFARSPEASLERLEGPQVRIKRVQVFPYGARFDLKLGAPAEEATHVLLQVAAEAPSPEPPETG